MYEKFSWDDQFVNYFSHVVYDNTVKPIEMKLHRTFFFPSF